MFLPPVPLIGIGIADPLAQWVAQVGNNGGSVSSGLQTTVGALITGLTTDGIWPKLDRLWLYAGESDAAAAKTDVVARQLASVVNSPGLTNAGYLGASGKYIDSGFNPATASSPHMVPASASIFAWTNQSGGDPGSLFGDVGGSQQTRCLPQYDGDDNLYAGPFLYAWSGYVNVYTAAPGLYLGNRTSAATYSVDFNGSEVSNSPVDNDNSALSPYSANFISLAGGPSSESNSSRVACYGFGGGLTTGNRTALYSRLRTWATAVGLP